MNNNSVLPYNLAKVTSKSLDTVSFSTDGNSKIMNNLDPNKAHSHDILSARMTKFYGNSICKPLSIIFNDWLKEGKLPSHWKKAHVVPVHTKGDKQCLKGYRSISLLPICSKIFERLIYNEIFTFSTDNDLISPNQSGFSLGDSWGNQLIAITHKIYKWGEFS